MALPFLILSAASREAAFATNVGGYRPGGAHRPVAAALSLTIAGGIGAALVFALVAPSIEEFFPAPMTGTNIPVEPVEPEPTPQPTAQPPVSIITGVRPLVEVPRFTPPVIGEIVPDPGPLTTVIPPDFGNGGGVVIAPPHVPVFRTATRNSRYADRFQPAYPPAMERQEIEGRCPVNVTISASGRVTAVRDNGCANETFFNATQRQAMSNWRFNPATRDGLAVESTQDIAVKFEIRQ